MSGRRELIDKFWSGNISDSELKGLLDLLDHDGALREELESAFYSSFEEDATLKKEGSSKIKSLAGKISIRWLSAAVVLFAVALVSIFFWKNKLADDSRVGAQVTSNQVKDATRRFINTSTYPTKLRLPDHSTVELSPGGTIEFDSATFITNRSITLDGTAFFTVHANRRYPFNVESGGVRTIATGTKFQVATSRNEIRVKLIEGKVLIKHTNKAQVEIRLKAGETFLWNNMTHQYMIERSENRSGKLDTIKSKQIIKPAAGPYNEINFVNDSLSKVFEILSAKYDTPITYAKDEIKGIYFTGKILATDKLQTVLELIANMNNLKLENRNNQIFIHAANRVQLPR